MAIVLVECQSWFWLPQTTTEDLHNVAEEKRESDGLRVLHLTVNVYKGTLILWIFPERGNHYAQRNSVYRKV